MEEEKRKLFIHRIVWFAILSLCVVFTIILFAQIFDDNSQLNNDYLILYLILPIIMPYLDLVMLAFFICTLTYSTKAYCYNGNVIVVYAGASHHYLKVNGVIVDEYVSSMAFHPIRLSSTLSDGSIINATVSLSNRISLKINNKLYTATI